jgi:rod shape-determining protein MreD
LLLEIAVIAVGLLLSHFLKGINFLSINWDITGVIYPDFLLIFVIFFALRRGEFSGLWIGFFAGLLEDSGILRFDFPEPALNVIGVHAIIYTLTGFILGKLNRIIDRDSTIPIMFVVFTTTFICRFLVWFIMGILDESSASYAFFGPAVYTAILSPVWFFLLGWAYRQTAEEENAGV